MRYMLAYDFMETLRNTNQWLGATAQAMGSYPQTGLMPSPFFKMLAAWGEGKPVGLPWTDLTLPAPFAISEGLAHQAEDLHELFATALWWLLGAHIAAALLHHLWLRDDTLRRMLR